MAKQLTTEIILKGMTHPSLTKAFKNASKLSESGLDSLKSLGSTAVKVGKVVGVATAGAIAGLGKSAIQSYAEYEQLVGGVQTLFKDSAGNLMNYADKAYQTAGLSANQYMSTITSFSAAMINSLGGDTKKATELSNQAVIDMSDNANKMGTSMDSIMQTYQSLSRGQYAMLDNLKLGYGGTKKEMERLLVDAEKLTGVKYDISKFSDVTSAINAIQEQMGIAGTTALEASTTIQGSWNQLKGSWANLMTGLADPKQDLGVLMERVMDSASVFLNDNLIPRIKEVLPRIATAISGFTPMLTDAVSSLIPPLIPVFINGAVAIMKAIVSSLPKIFSSLMSALPTHVAVIGSVIAGAFAGIKILGIIKGIMSAITVIKTLVSTFGIAKVALLALGGPVGWIALAVGALIGVFVALWTKCKPFKDFFVKTIPNALNTAKTVIVNFFTNTIPTAFNNAITFLKQLPATIVNFFSSLPSKIGYFIGFAIGKVILFGKKLWNFATVTIPQFISKTVTWFAKLPSRIWTWLVNTAQKVVAWGTSLASKGRAAAQKLLTAVVSKVKEIPSKMLSIGKNIVKGLWNGISNAKDWLIKQIKSFATGIKDGIAKALGIHSPSVVMEKLFKWVPVGAGEGILNNAKYAVNAVKAMGSKIASTASNLATTVTANVVPTNPKPNTSGGGSSFKDMAVSAGKAVANKVYQLTFAPVVNGGNAEENRKMLEEEMIKFREMIEEFFAEKERLAY